MCVGCKSSSKRSPAQKLVVAILCSLNEPSHAVGLGAGSHQASICSNNDVVDLHKTNEAVMDLVKEVRAESEL